MIIRYMNGQELEGVLLSQTEDSMRVGLRDDVLVLNRFAGRWITADCEPVHVEFPWTARGAPVNVDEEDCICPPQLAARLQRLLANGESEPEPRDIVRRAAVLLLQPLVF